MPYNFAAESFYTNFVADFLREKSIFRRQGLLFVTEPRLGD